MTPGDLAVGIFAGDFEHNDVLQRNRIFFHTEHFGDVRDLT